VHVAPCGIRHVIEFRHPSWHARRDVAEICRRHGLCIAWAHFENSAGWAGEMPSGWSPCERTPTADFVYHRLFGPDGRNQGKYTERFLQEEIVEKLAPGSQGFIMFAQDSEPTHARENAIKVQEFLEEGSFEVVVEEDCNFEAPHSPPSAPPSWSAAVAA